MQYLQEEQENENGVQQFMIRFVVGWNLALQKKNEACKRDE